MRMMIKSINEEEFFKKRKKVKANPFSTTAVCRRRRDRRTKFDAQSSYQCELINKSNAIPFFSFKSAPK
jgi:hypothetical protein